jgi:prefoldin subunit 2
VLVQKLMEIEDEKKENELVLESISKLEDGRKCWRLINGVLMEKTKLEVVPEMRVVINNLNAVVKQITDTLVSVRQEIKNLEAAYEHIMKASKSQAT